MNKRKKIILLLAALIIIAASLTFVVINHNKQIESNRQKSNDMSSNGAIVSDSENKSTSIVGTWLYSDGTRYQFDSDLHGGMYIDDYKYTFTYSVNDDTVEILYDKEEVHDSVYQFSLEGDILRLIGGEGTAGGEYELTRIR